MFKALFNITRRIFLIGGTQASDNTLPGPEGTGVVFILHMTANPDASGTSRF